MSLCSYTKLASKYKKKNHQKRGISRKAVSNSVPKTMFRDNCQ